ncbi:MAG TPA: DUF3307 domain-containing protein [Alphaproteobacteria bacterium]|nr:DUF3307 domain-containing protein [Alphaproteobacteria bacterium]
MTLISLLLLYLAFRAKQFACDFLLQTKWMALTKGKDGAEGYKALATHAGIHALATLIVIMIFAPALWWLAVFDFIIHGAIDRLKALATADLKLSASDSKFWWAFGLDQEAHNLTHLGYILMIILYYGGVNLSV